MKYLCLLLFIFQNNVLSAEDSILTVTQAMNLGILIKTEDRKLEPEVYQREYILTHANEFEYVQTVGVYTCVALIVHEKKSSKGMLVHFDSNTNIDRELEKLRRNFDWSESTISLIGGLSDNRKLFNEITKKVEEIGGTILVKINNERNAAGINLRFNLKTGQISYYSEKYVSTPTNEARVKVQRIRSGDQLFRHTSSIGGGDPVFNEYEQHNLDSEFKTTMPGLHIR